MLFRESLSARPLIDEPDLPPGAEPPLVFLLDVSSGFERQVLEGWIARHHPAELPHEVLRLAPSRRRRRPGAVDPYFEQRVTAEDNPTFVPLRVVWLPPEREGRRSFRLSDVFRFGDLRDPEPVRARWIYLRYPDLVRVVVGPSGTGAALRAAWEESGDISTLAEYATRRAHLALEKAERELRGARYKVPRFIQEEVLRKREFRDELEGLATRLGKSPEAILRRAQRYLKEIAATHSTYVIDIVANGVRWLYSQGYRELTYDEEPLREIARLSAQHPVVFLPSHKSNLDHLVLSYVLWERGLPPNHTAGGINMNFFPVGPIVRRTGVFFIRRSFKDKPVYKAVLRNYLDYLIEKRFPLEWYLEGGRSRSGKMLPPRYGLLAYIVDAYRRGCAEDVYLLPVAIAYDQVQDVQGFAAEQRGDVKESENFGWLIRAVRSLRRRHGNIYVRFAEPLSLSKELDTELDEEAEALEVRKLAFEVLSRVGRSTPITGPALVSSAFLSSGDRALSPDEVADRVAELGNYVETRGLPTAPSASLSSPDQLEAVLKILIDHGIVTSFEGGPEPVYQISPRRFLEAAYYRNTIVHFFLNGAISEVALLAATDVAPERRLERFWEAVMAWRDLLKFEFFFSAKNTYREEVRSELELVDPGWEETMTRERGIDEILAQMRPLRAHWVLAPWLEGYQVVAGQLVTHDPDRPVDVEAFLKSCLGAAEQYLLQRKITSPESVSKVVFESALRLADNRGLLDVGSTDPVARRRAFQAEIDVALGRIRAVRLLAERRRSEEPAHG